jgi:RsiW-degrading membrane proteinase PrsW (M82 family)
LDCTFPLAVRRPSQPKRVRWSTHIWVVLLSLLGGLLGIGGAFISEVGAGGILLGVFIGAPVIEEAFKPIGVYLSLVKWPDALRNQLYIALLCAAAGLIFGILEAIVYLYVYVPDHSARFKLYRLTIPLALHAVASYTVGLGLDRRIVGVVNRGDPLPKRTRNFYLAGVGLHAAFNTGVTILSVAGFVDFD